MQNRHEQTLKSGLIFIGLLMQVVGLIVFIFFFQQSFLASYTTEKFVSLSKDSGVCTEVCIRAAVVVCVFTFVCVFTYFEHYISSHTQTHTITHAQVSRPYTIPFITADFEANWQGTLDFNSNLNYYAFNLFDLSLTLGEYQDLMKSFADAVAVVGYMAERSELAVNLLYFNSWTHSITTEGSLGGKVTQTMSFASHAINILGTDFISGTVMDVKVKKLRRFFMHISHKHALTNTCTNTNTHTHRAIVPSTPRKRLTTLPQVTYLHVCTQTRHQHAYIVNIIQLTKSLAHAGELIMTFSMEHWFDTGNYTYLQPCVHALDEIYLGYDSDVSTTHTHKHKHTLSLSL